MRGAKDKGVTLKAGCPLCALGSMSCLYTSAACTKVHDAQVSVFARVRGAWDHLSVHFLAHLACQRGLLKDLKWIHYTTELAAKGRKCGSSALSLQLHLFR